ncbi:MAG: hypothetical protein AAB401_21365, partial [Acidobacteriota bacterium]
MRKLLPEQVYRDLSRHILRAGHKAEEGFPSGEEEEDSLTGDFLRAVRRAWSKDIQINGSVWRWRVTTKKFRGRGELATESLIGADGIVQVEVTSPDSTVARKGLLFQAKKNWKHRSQELLAQVKKMESEAPGGSAVFDYASDAYRGFTAKAVLENDARPQIIGYRRLGEFLVDEFLECLVGRWDTYYDWDKKTLVLQKWPPSLWYHL